MKQMAFGTRVRNVSQLFFDPNDDEKFVLGASAADVRGLNFSYFNNPGNKWGVGSCWHSNTSPILGLQP